MNPSFTRNWFVIILLSLSFFTLSFAQSWIWQNPLPSGNCLHTVKFFASGQGWVAGLYGTIAHTTDGGLTWTMQTSGTSQGLNYLTMVNERHGWIVGDSILLHTADGGNHWETVTVAPGFTAKSVAFADSSFGWVVGNSGQIYCTADGGSTWSLQTSNSTAQLYFVRCIDRSHCWIAGGTALLRTVNGGETWTTTTGTRTPSRFTFLNADTGWGVGAENEGGYICLRTVNGGVSWTTNNGGWFALASIDFTDAHNGWVVGEAGIIHHSTDGGQSWQSQSSGVTNGVGLTDVSFVDSLHGWATGHYGILLHTIDGGATWGPMVPSFTGTLNDVCFVDSSNGWAVGTNNSGTAQCAILHTANGGTSWERQTGGGTMTGKGVAFINPDTGWVVGDHGVYKTINGGGDWVLQTDLQALNYNHIFFLNERHGWMVGLNGRIMHTSDGGASWFLQTNNYTGSIDRIEFADSVNGWLAGYDSGSRNYYLYHTTTGGTNWSLQHTGTGFAVYDFAVISPSECWVAGGSVNTTPQHPLLLHTLDGGANWNDVSPNVSYELHGLVWFDSNHGTICGSNGMILTTTDGGTMWSRTVVTNQSFTTICATDRNHSWVVGLSGTILFSGRTSMSDVTEPVTSKLPKEFVLHPNYPNPFNSSTTISYSLPISGNVDLKIFDLQGREVQSVYSGSTHAGSYRASFDGKGLASGTYFVRLQMGEAVRIQKIVLLK